MENRLDELIAHIEQSKMNDFYINIKNCFNWFKNHMGDTEWNTRKNHSLTILKQWKKDFLNLITLKTHLKIE